MSDACNFPWLALSNNQTQCLSSLQKYMPAPKYEGTELDSMNLGLHELLMSSRINILKQCVAWATTCITDYAHIRNDQCLSYTIGASAF